jgi:hypothetical protein
MSNLVETDRIQSKASYALPPSFTREIGRIIVRWAFFERQIQQMVWGVAFDGDSKGAALGRLAILEAKFPERLDLLAKLAKVRNVKYDAKTLKSIRSRSPWPRGTKRASQNYPRGVAKRCIGHVPNSHCP